MNQKAIKEEKKSSKLNFNWGILITSLITVSGWAVGSYFNSERDRENKLREIKINYLIDAYRKLANSSIRTTNYEHFKFDMESAVSDIQLFGTKDQIEQLNVAIDNMKKNKFGLDVDEILKLLRNDLREEILLDTINANVSWIRFNEAGIDSILKEKKSQDKQVQPPQ